MPEASENSAPKNGNILRWGFSLLVLATVLFFAFHLSEQKDFLTLVHDAHPGWISAGLALQLGTYYMQALVWKTGLRERGAEVSPHKLVELSLAQLFINQVFPSASLSGALFVTRSFKRRGIPLGTVANTLALNMVSYFEAIALSTMLTVILMGAHHFISPGLTITSAAVIFVYCLLLFIFAPRISLGRVIAFFEKRKLHHNRILKKILGIRDLIEFEGLGHPLILRAAVFQLLVFALDSFTLWCMLRSIGITAGLDAVFISYMSAYLVRCVIVLPGGVGVFEAASIAVLNRAGIPMAGSIAATLLYRGLSFWLPMLPGLFLVRRELKR